VVAEDFAAAAALMPVRAVIAMLVEQASEAIDAIDRELQAYVAEHGEWPDGTHRLFELLGQACGALDALEEWPHDEADHRGFARPTA
jgi:hypothetical protein